MTSKDRYKHGNCGIGKETRFQKAMREFLMSDGGMATTAFCLALMGMATTGDIESANVVNDFFGNIQSGVGNLFDFELSASDAFGALGFAATGGYLVKRIFSNNTDHTDNSPPNFNSDDFPGLNLN